MATLVVHVEQHGGAARRASLETLGAANASGQTVVAVVGGEGGDAVASKLHASKVVVLPNDGKESPDRTAADVAAVVRGESAQGFLCAASSHGKDLLPRVAALLDSAPITDCTGFEWDGEGGRCVRPILAGKAIATLRSKSPVFCASLRPNVFTATEGTAGSVAQGSSSSEAKAVVTSVAEKAGGKLDVSEAAVVVSGGRGLKEPENFKIVEELADAFGNAAVGASRAVVDAGWRPHAEQVGQTGKTVAPQLYVAIGISGAIQHLAGMRTSKVIVAINKDAEAPIFKVADYGIVGDAFEVVPALTEAVRAARAR